MSTKKPVNDLIKFWAEKQDKEVEPISRPPRRPLSPTASLPPSPLNDSFYTPPLTPTHNNIHSLTFTEEKDNHNNDSVDDNNNGRSIVSDNSNSRSIVSDNSNSRSIVSDNSNSRSIVSDNSNSRSIVSDNSNSRSIVSKVDTQTSTNKNDLKGSLSENLSGKDSSNDETSTKNNVTKINTKDYNRKPRDYDLNIKDKVGSLPPARKVTDLVSKFEKVASPTNSVQTSPRLTPLKRGQTYVQSSPTSPLILSPINRNQFNPEDLSTSSVLNASALSAKTRRRQTVPEPLNFKFSDEPLSSSNFQIQNNFESTPISPLSLEPDSTLNIIQQTPEGVTKQTTKQTLPIKQQRQVSFKDDDISDQKNVSESNLNPDTIKKSNPEPLKQKTRPISMIQTDYLDFISETFKNSTFNLTDEKSSEITSIWKPTTETKPVSPPQKSLRNKSIITKRSNTVPRNKTSRGITNETPKNLNNYETPDLLPQPEPISPIRLNFSEFLASPNGSSTNLNLNSPLDEKLSSKLSTQDGEKGKQNNNTLIYKVVVETKSEVPKKNENSKSIKHISGTIHFIENLKRYLQPNKNKSSDDISAPTKKFTSQDINNDNQLNQIY